MSAPKEYLDLHKSRVDYDLRARISKAVPGQPETNTEPVPYELGDLLISYLEQLGVEYVFGIPGGAIEPLYNALARSERRGGPRAVVARHETGAAFMADGYARNSGKLGVCCGTAGPGTTNLMTGVASAYDNHAPLLVITAQTAITHFGKCAAQESGDTGINTVAMFEHCTHYSTLVSHPDQFESKLTTAIMRAFQSPKGPTHLSVPLDVLRSASTVQKPAYNLLHLLDRPALTDDASIAVFCDELLKCKRAVFIVGEGCAESVGLILDVALMLNVEIVTTPHAKGLVSPYHPLYRGVIGLGAHDTAVNALAHPEIDLVVAVGSTLSETASNGWDKHVLNQNLIHIDDVEANFNHSPMAKMHVRGNLTSTFGKILDLLKVRITYDPTLEKRKLEIEYLEKNAHTLDTSHRHFNVQDELSCRSNAVPIKPQRLMTELPKLFPHNTRYLCDSGNSMVWSIHYLHPYDRRIRSRRKPARNGSAGERVNGRRETRSCIFWTCLEYGSMGWAIGSSIGTAFACPADPVVCITGDGSMLMSGGEITVALQENLNTIFVILNDAELGMVKHGQRLGSGEPVGYQLPPVDFVKWGESLGIPGFYIGSSADLLALDIDWMLHRGGPTILDVRIDPEEVPPMQNRLKALGTLADSD